MHHSKQQKTASSSTKSIFTILRNPLRMAKLKTKPTVALSKKTIILRQLNAKKLAQVENSIASESTTTHSVNNDALSHIDYDQFFTRTPEIQSPASLCENDIFSSDCFLDLNFPSNNSLSSTVNTQCLNCPIKQKMPFIMCGCDDQDVLKSTTTLVDLCFLPKPNSNSIINYQDFELFSDCRQNNFNFENDFTTLLF